MVVRISTAKTRWPSALSSKFLVDFIFGKTGHTLQKDNAEGRRDRASERPIARRTLLTICSTRSVSRKGRAHQARTLTQVLLRQTLEDWVRTPRRERRRRKDHPMHAGPAVFVDRAGRILRLQLRLL